MSELRGERMNTVIFLFMIVLFGIGLLLIRSDGKDR